MAAKKRSAKRAPAEGSEAWYEKQWRIILSAGPAAKKALPKALAKLSYNDRLLCERVLYLEDAMEEMEERFYAALHTFAVGFNNIADAEALARDPSELIERRALSNGLHVKIMRRNDGMVKIDAVPHLRECLKVLTPGSEVCTCGSQPPQGRDKPN